MGRRTFSKEFKVEAVRLFRERGVSIALPTAVRRHLGDCKTHHLHHPFSKPSSTFTVLMPICWTA